MDLGLTPAQWAVLVTTICTGVATVLTAVAGLRRARGEVRTEMELECLDRLKVSRLESESLRDELIILRRRASEL